MQLTVYLIDRNLGIFRSDGKRKAEAPYLDFLLEGEGIKCFCNIDYDMANLASLILRHDEMQTLAKFERVHFQGYSLTYFPDKMVSLRHGDKEVTFCDLAQYSEGLKAVSERSVDSRFTTVQWAARLANEVYQSFVKLGFKPESLISAPNVFKHSRLDNMDLPTVEDESIPIDALIMAEECCKGGWTDVFTIGHFDRVFDYDLRSAYPSETAKLLDLRRGRWERSLNYLPDAKYGYCKCEVMTDAPFHPILHDVGNLTIAGNGVYQTCLTKAQIDFVNEWQLGYVTILDGWWWIPFSTPQHELFKGVVQNLYDKKESRSGLERDIVKRMLNGTFYGLFLQRVGANKSKPGRYYMSPYGAEIQCNTQLNVARACLENHIIPLHIAVDGFLTTKRLPIVGTGIGSWKLSHEGPAIVVGTMLWAIQGKQGEGDFSVSYDWLKSQIEANPQAESYEKKTKAILTLGRAVAEHRESELGSVCDVSRAVNVTDGDYKRMFVDLPRCGGDILKRHYKSVAWDEALLTVGVS